MHFIAIPLALAIFVGPPKPQTASSPAPDTPVASSNVEAPSAAPATLTNHELRLLKRAYLERKLRESRETADEKALGSAVLLGSAVAIPVGVIAATVALAGADAPGPSIQANAGVAALSVASLCAVMVVFPLGVFGGLTGIGEAQDAAHNVDARQRALDAFVAGE